MTFPIFSTPRRIALLLIASLAVAQPAGADVKKHDEKKPASNEGQMKAHEPSTVPRIPVDRPVTRTKRRHQMEDASEPSVPKPKPLND